MASHSAAVVPIRSVRATLGLIPIPAGTLLG